jgi:hypothetical protein
MEENEGNVVQFRRDDLSTVTEAANDDTAANAHTTLLAHRVKYGLRLILSIVLMWLQGPVKFVCVFLNIIVGLAFVALLIFKSISTGPLWLLAGIGFLLFLIPLLLEFLIYWIMPTK